MYDEKDLLRLIQNIGGRHTKPAKGVPYVRKFGIEQTPKQSGFAIRKCTLPRRRQTRHGKRPTIPIPTRPDIVGVLQRSSVPMRRDVLVGAYAASR
jgi:hypothetical protein